MSDPPAPASEVLAYAWYGRYIYICVYIYIYIYIYMCRDIWIYLSMHYIYIYHICLFYVFTCMYVYDPVGIISTEARKGWHPLELEL